MILDRTALLAKLLSLLPTNANRQITAEALREVLADFVESQFNLTDDDGLLNPPDISGKLNRSGDTMEGPLVLAGDPGSALGAATKQYVDTLLAAAVSNVKWKSSVRGAVVDRPGPLAPVLSGTYTTIDGVALVAGDRVIVASTVSAALNGIYVVAAGAWARATDADTGAKLVGATAAVEEGTSFGDKILLVATNAPITLGTTPITWVTFAQPNNYTAGTGLALSGNQFSVDSTVQRRTVTPVAIVSGALDMDQPRRSFTTTAGTAQTLNLSSLSNAAAGKDVFIRYTSTNAADALTVAMAGVTVRTQGVFVPTVINDVIIEAISATELVVLINPVF